MFKKVLLTIVYLVAVTGLVLFIIKMLEASENRSMPLAYTPTPTPTPYVYLAYESMKEVPVIFDVQENVTPAVTEAVTKDNDEIAGGTDDEMKDVTPTRGIMILEENNTPDPLVTVAPTDIPAPTVTVAPTDTPLPTATVAPTDTPLPTATVTPTSTPLPTATVTPTSTPVPTATVTPTNTPVPTSTPKLMPEYGAASGLKKAGLGRTLDGIAFVANESKNANTLNFSSGSLEKLSGTAILENYDFSDYDLIVLYEGAEHSPASIIFKNCRFGNFQKSSSALGTSVYMEFENCTFSTFLGTDATFRKCVFTDIFEWYFSEDENVSFSNCLFSDAD